MRDEFCTPLWQRGAEDHRDHIYALLGIGQDMSWEEPNLIDYSLPVEFIYQRFAVRWITMNRSLQTLLNCCAGKQTELTYKLPSWAKDWTESHCTPYWQCSAFEDSEMFREKMEPFSFVAEDNENWEIHEPNINALLVWATKLTSSKMYRKLDLIGLLLQHQVPPCGGNGHTLFLRNGTSNHIGMKNVGQSFGEL